MLAWDFLKLVFIAILIAAPLSWLIMHQWLQGFTYRENIKRWVLPLSALAAVLIALATISWQSIKASTANPLKSLKTE
jgi:putative ABC transport system permease protein